MAEDQRNARIFGVLFLITYVTSIGALALFQSVLDDPAAYIAGDGKDSQIYLGAFLELLLVLANVGTAVVLYPIVRRQNELLAIGYVAARIIECVFIAAGSSRARSRQSAPGLAGRGRPRRLARCAQGLDVPVRPGLIVPFGNGLILGYLMYRSGLVPRRMAWLGLIGGPLLLIGNIGMLFDWWDQTPVSSWSSPSSCGSCPSGSTRRSGVPEGCSDPSARSTMTPQNDAGRQRAVADALRSAQVEPRPMRGPAMPALRVVPGASRSVRLCL